ncbi:band 7 protein AGAP004871-like isoform X2 [Panonychus citri]|uniref:band 7 protein AGAP004871-like isoform X2 n=1 Tax=Panonychus citri TaxID=50023 RepID=UPI002306FE1F|nr:band 7 protein AGAP004871-like isoform X2 [Panonychus citri]XP_053205904.1 band 7 protein AGAP004871-like isoform X2 [Panonychus citri]
MERRYHNVSSSSSPVPTIVTLGNIDGRSSVTHTTTIKDSSLYPMINHPKQQQLANINNNQQQHQQIISSSTIRHASKSEPSQLNQSFNHQINNINNNQNPGFLWIGESAISDTIGHNPGLCALILTVISVILIVLTLPLSLFFCIKVVQEYERAVIFRLGRLVKGGAKGPGIFFIIPCIDTYSKVDLRTVSFDVPPQEILSKDSVTVAVDAVVYYRISNATIAVSNVEDYGRSTRLLAATTLRNVLGTKNLSEILSERESISHVMQSSLDEATDPWGVKVERVEIKDARLPVQLQRAMATEAEAAREARAKVIAAEGEQRASRALKEAAEVIHGSPAALQLRYLQTLNSIAAEKNSTIVFPLPIDLFRGFLNSGRWTEPFHGKDQHHEGNDNHQHGNNNRKNVNNKNQSNIKPKVTFPDEPTRGQLNNNLSGNQMTNAQTNGDSVNQESLSTIQSQSPIQPIPSSSSAIPIPSQSNNQVDHQSLIQPQQFESQES